jgi:hypothetical protein
MKKSTQILLAFIFGVIFVIVILALNVWISQPTVSQYEVFKIILALAAAGVAAVLPGILNVQFGSWLKAGGALAVFAIVYFKSPARLAVQTVKSPEDIEIEKPLLNTARDAVVTSNEGTSFDFDHGYNTLRIDGTTLVVPDRKVVVANNVEFVNGGGLSGRRYSVVARTVHNGSITADGAHGGSRNDGKDGGQIFLYVKEFNNTNVTANGGNGGPGSEGDAGNDGKDGANGQDGRCGPGITHQFRGSTAGGDGENGGPGSDGKPGGKGGKGGSILLTAIRNEPELKASVSGGLGGSGGSGGSGGAAGRGGTGGAGCNGLGGSQPDRPSGKNGLPGKSGKKGADGDSGTNGTFAVELVKDFSFVSGLLSTGGLPPDLHDQLQLRKRPITPRR